MRYIRTEDGIYEYEKVKTRVFVQDGFYSKEKTLSEEESLKLFPYKIIAQADIIEELCDEFVAIRKVDGFKFLAEIRKAAHGRTLAIKTDLFTLRKPLIKSIKKDFKVYGAIWTDKGLQFVAKMNEKGVLELL